MGHFLLLVGRAGANHAPIAKEQPARQGVVGIDLVGVHADPLARVRLRQVTEQELGPDEPPQLTEGEAELFLRL